MRKHGKLIPSLVFIPCIFTVKCDQRFLHIIAVTWSVSIIFLTLILALPILTNLPGLLFSPDLSRPFTTYASPTRSWTPLGIEGSSSRLPHEVQYWSHSLAQSVASDESWASRWKTCVNFGEQNFETPKLIQENATTGGTCNLDPQTLLRLRRGSPRRSRLGDEDEPYFYYNEY